MSKSNRDNNNTPAQPVASSATGFSKFFVASTLIGAILLSSVGTLVLSKKIDIKQLTAGTELVTGQVACPQLLIESITALQALPTVQQQLADLGRGGAEQNAVVNEVAATEGFKALNQPANFLNVANYLNAEAQRLFDLSLRLNPIEAEFTKNGRTSEWNAIVVAALESKGLKSGQSARTANPVINLTQVVEEKPAPSVMQSLVSAYQKR